MVDNMLFEKTHAKITALCFVPCVVPSCIKMHATGESWITYRGWIIRATSCTLQGNHKSPIGVIIRATSCTLRGNRESRIGIHYSCNKLHATRESWITYRGDHSCIEMHATRESWITYRGWIIRATSCTLRGNHKSPIEVESFVQQVARYEGIVNHVSGWLFVQQVARYEGIVNYALGLNHSCYWIQKAYLV